MQLQFPSFAILFTFLLFMFMVINIWKRSKTNDSTLKLPPGPGKLPIIGNLHMFIGTQPHRRLKDLAKKYGPLMHLKLGEISTVVVSSPEIAKEVMKTHDIIFATRPFQLPASIVHYDSTDIAFSPYGEYWRQVRKFCIMKLLTRKRVDSFRSIREEEVSCLIRSISSVAGSPINLPEKLFSFTWSVISRAVLGKKCKDQEEFLSAVKEFLTFLGGFSVADVFPSFKLLHVITGMRSRLEMVHQKVDRILENIINEHKASKKITEMGEDEPHENLVDFLLNVQKHGNLKFTLTNDNIKSLILDIFSAGSDASSRIVEWAISEMLKNPSVMEKAQAEVRQVFSRKGNVDEAGLEELTYLKLVIKETLRLHPPAPLLLPRECREKCEINGYDIPVKTRVIINAWAMGRDPKCWAEAERFYPERFLDNPIDFKGADFEFIPFGAGRRMCPGMAYGVANVELPLAHLLYHFDWKFHGVTKPEDLDMTEASGASARRIKDLSLIPIPYHPVPID